MNSKLVVDSSVVVKWFVTETDSDCAQQIYDEYQNGSLILLAPSLLFAEVANIVWKKHVLQGMEASDASDIMAAMPLIDFEITPIANLVEDAFRLAVAHQRTIYDALYLALTQREQCRFVTADERLVNAVKQAMPDVVNLHDWAEANK